MDQWLDREGRFFNPRPRISQLPLPPGRGCVVIDGALANPEGVAAWAATQRFGAPAGYPYPGLVCDAPDTMQRRIADHFTQHVRKPLGVRRLQSLAVRLSLVTTPPQQLQPIQWLCHRDRLVRDGGNTLFAASVLYLFRDPALGGTSFYRPRLGPAQTEQLVADSQTLSAADYGVRYGLQAGYMDGSNAYFDRVAQVPAAWNRVIYYDGGLFHSADVGSAGRMRSDPRSGRLTLNAFITCRKTAS